MWCQFSILARLSPVLRLQRLIGLHKAEWRGAKIMSVAEGGFYWQEGQYAYSGFAGAGVHHPPEVDLGFSEFG